MDLTYPRKDSTTLRSLLPRVLTRMVQQYLSLPPDVPGSLRHTAHDVAHAVVRTDAAALADALRLPTHSALLGAVLHDGDAARDARNELDLQVLFELAAATGLPEPVRVECPSNGWPALLSIRSGVRVDVGDAASQLEFATHAVLYKFVRGFFEGRRTFRGSRSRSAPSSPTCARAWNTPRRSIRRNIICWAHPAR